MGHHQVFQIGQNDQWEGKKKEQTSDPVHRKENERKEWEGVPTEKMHFRQLLPMRLNQWARDQQALEREHVWQWTPAN